MGKDRSSWNLALPLSPKVIFVDWDGVLSRMRYWDAFSAPKWDLTVPVLRRALDQMFAQDEVIGDWMTGKLGTSDVIRDHLPHPTPPPLVDDMHRFVVEQCEEAPIDDRWLLAALRSLRSDYQVVLATDNMDCFTEGIRERLDLSGVFDDYISSSDVGALKADAPDVFFGEWLRGREVEVQNCILIDDRRSNCEAFERIGGRAILFGTDAARADIIELVWPT
jgi:FMN phosphatase YigB (HAD superfamily)